MRINTEDAITATQYEYFTPCAQGLEAVVAGELKALGAERVRPLQAGVAFFGPLKTGYRACLWLRSASRVLLVLSRVEATDADCLYESVKALPWEQHLDPSRTIAIHARGTNEKLGDTRFIALKVKDALCDRLRELTGRRPSVQKDRPDVKLDVSLRSNRATVSLDLSGEPLHMRKYRVPDYRIVAPLRETLAAFMCIKAGWDAPFHENFSKVLLDPLCGSGTIALEAALIALDRAPGLLRDYWGFTGWLAHEEELWQETLREAQSRAAVALQSFVVSGSKPLIHASDSDEASVQIARESARLAGVEKIIDFEVADIATIAPSVDKTGTGERLVITNPPYGHRLSSESKLPALYSALQSLNDPSASPAPCDLCLITSDEGAQAYLGAVPSWQIETFNGPLEVSISFYARHQLASPVDPRDIEQFENRLKKMALHRAKWARRSGVTCYRVYDADLPSFAVAIDLYEGAGQDEHRRFLHIAEYAPPKHIEAALAAQRLSAVLSSAPRILDVPLAQVYLKTRRRAKGGSQYARKSIAESKTPPESFTVKEGGLLFKVDFSSHLDTGIFLDHRETRALLKEQARGRDTLNLFAYTGCASVYMAAGGASSVTTVDLSKTYLRIAEQNMKQNGFQGAAYRYQQEDVLRWVREQRSLKTKYGLIFCDPPTFSNSKSTGKQTWDVQRDHAELLVSLSRMLTKDGVIVFSTNLRSFSLDEQVLKQAGIKAKDISARTIPPDFERSPKIHRCYLL